MSLERRAAARLLAGMALATVLVAGCRKTAPPPRVESVRVAESSLAAAGELGLERAAVEAAARRALLEAGFVLAAEPPGYRARIEVIGLRLVPGTGGGLRVQARVELELTSAEGKEPARRDVGTGGQAIGEGGPGQAAGAALGAAIGEAARGLRVGLTAEGKPVEALLADLESSDARVRDHAVQALGERRDPRAVPGLIRRLSDADRQVVDRAIGALAQLRDPRAVPALIDLSRGTDATIALRLVPVVGDIGGPDAEGWLLTLEQADPDPRVRAAAAEALSGLRRPEPSGRK